MTKRIPFFLTTLALTACFGASEETRQITDDYSSARITAPVTVTIASDASDANKGRVDFECPDAERDSLILDVVAGQLLITSEKDENMQDCNVTLHATNNFDLQVSHDKEANIYHARGGNLNLTELTASEARVFAFGESTITLGDVYGDEVNFQLYDQATVTHEGEMVVEEVRADLWDLASVDFKDITAFRVAVEAVDFATADLDGQVGKVKISAENNTMIDASTLYATEAEVNADHDSEVMVYAADKAEIAAEGQAVVEVMGEPDETDVNQDDGAIVIGI